MEEVATPVYRDSLIKEVERTLHIEEPSYLREEIVVITIASLLRGKKVSAEVLRGVSIYLREYNSLSTTSAYTPLLPSITLQTGKHPQYERFYQKFLLLYWK